jgi:hypothetical protein
MYLGASGYRSPRIITAYSTDEEIPNLAQRGRLRLHLTTSHIIRLHGTALCAVRGLLAPTLDAPPALSTQVPALTSPTPRSCLSAVPTLMSGVRVVFIQVAIDQLSQPLPSRQHSLDSPADDYQQNVYTSYLCSLMSVGI